MLKSAVRGPSLALALFSTLMLACAPPTPLDAAIKAALVRTTEGLCNIDRMDAVTVCLGVRDGVDGGDPKEAYLANQGFVRDPEKSFIRMLQREMIRGNPIFKSISECGGLLSAMEGGRYRLTVEHARLMDERHARVEIAMRWGSAMGGRVYSTYLLERGEHGWRITKEW